MKWSLVAIMLLTLASCQDKNALDPSLEGFFPEDVGETYKPQQFLEVSAAAGARADAMLANQHFDGPRLNSLGQAKLDLMLKDDRAAAPLTVYLNFPEKDATSGKRHDAVA